MARLPVPSAPTWLSRRPATLLARVIGAYASRATPSSRSSLKAPVAPSDFQLAPASDTGIVGDDITSDRTPEFIGTALAGETVELFETGSSAARFHANIRRQLRPLVLTFGTLTSGSASVTGITSTTGLFVGENVAGSGIPSGTTIEAVNSSGPRSHSRRTRRPVARRALHRDEFHDPVALFLDPRAARSRSLSRPSIPPATSPLPATR